MQLTVNQATPTITWATPAPIAAGTALSATQLDATANVPGSFMYNPAAGAVLAAGTQQLTAVFSPTDATDYSSSHRAHFAHHHFTLESTGKSRRPTPDSAHATRPRQPSSDRMRRSHHQPEQRHEPEHAAEQQLTELGTARNQYS